MSDEMDGGIEELRQMVRVAGIAMKLRREGASIRTTAQGLGMSKSTFARTEPFYKLLLRLWEESGEDLDALASTLAEYVPGGTKPEAETAIVCGYMGIHVPGGTKPSKYDALVAAWNNASPEDRARLLREAGVVAGEQDDSTSGGDR